MEVQTVMVDLGNLELGAFTPRMIFDEKWIQELAEDIRRNGQQKPIIVQRRPEPPYPVIDGEHRCRAVKRLGADKIRAEVRDVSDEEAEFLAMRVNELHGKRLNDFERGKRLYELQKNHGWTQEKLAEVLGRSQPWVSNRINLYLKSNENLKTAIITRVIDVSKAREIVALPEDGQKQVIEKVVDEGLSTRETKFLTHALNKADEEETTKILTSPVKAIAEIYAKPEAFERGVKAPAEQPMIEWFECPKCGTRLMIDWVERRVRAAILAGLKEVPTIIRG